MKRKEQEQKRQKHLHRKKFLIPLTRKDRLDPFSERGVIAFDPPGNGNCQFSALCFFLRSIGIERSPETLRREIVRYLQQNPNDLEGFPLELFVGQRWSDYLAEMIKDGTYGDHITLQAAANIFNVQFTVHSSLGVEANTVISSFGHNGVANFNLGHFAEGQREHYVCLEVAQINAENPSDEGQENQQRWTEEGKEKEQVEEKNEEREAVQETKKTSRTNGGSVGDMVDQPGKEDGWDGICDTQNEENRREGPCSFD